MQTALSVEGVSGLHTSDAANDINSVVVSKENVAAVRERGGRQREEREDLPYFYAFLVRGLVERE